MSVVYQQRTDAINTYGGVAAFAEPRSGLMLAA
jgi:hypothetical protein